MRTAIVIDTDAQGTVTCDVPEYLTPDQLGLVIQAASHQLKCKQVELGKAKDQVGNTARPDFHQFETGVRRSEVIGPRYDLIPEGPLRRLALRYTMGAQKYGEWNWQKGLPLSDTFNHIVEHLLSARADLMKGHALTVDDDLAGAAWGIFTLMFFQDRGDYSGRVPSEARIPVDKRDAINKLPDPRD
jgi:hypothetical protein